MSIVTLHEVEAVMQKRIDTREVDRPAALPAPSDWAALWLEERS
jgi:hypothetical protein